MQLKNYQSEALKILQHFCKEYSKSGLISQSYSATKNLFEQSNPTYLDYEGLNVPNVCLRIPTGGGKTLLAVHSLPIITFDLLNNASSLVFWLAPSEQIVEQTINALKNPRHPYRKYLDGVFAGRTVNVLSIEEAYSKAFDISCELPIIIATIQTFSAESEEGRRFYRENGVYQEFFENSSETPSLYNAIKKCNPIVIMDEAHNAKTDLRVSSLVKLEPSFVLELTATPRKEHRPAEGKYASNVIYSVSASQLKAEDMIKLPIRLETVSQWQSAIRDAIEKRNELEELCKLEQIETGEYIRPLILFRAESNRGTNPVTHETILETLLNDYRIDRSEIAVHTSGHTELKNVDLMLKDCPIRYVITVEALKEGWDAPFAYILASVGDINSPTAVEQILGRILRLPYAKRKHYDDLEKAYAYVASTKTTEVIKNLRDSLVNNGFEELEANLNISFSHNSNQASDVVLGGLFEERETKLESFDIEAIPEKFKSYINVNHKEKMFSIIKLIPPKEEEEFKKAISKAVTNEEDRKKILSILEKPPILLNFNKPFSLSRLLIKRESELFEFDKSILLEEIEWTEKEILQYAKLDENEFNIAVKRELAELDISDREKIQVRYLHDIKENLFTTNGESLKLNENDLTRLILKHIDHNDLQTIGSRQLTKFVYAVVLYLAKDRNMDIIELKSNIYLLTEVIFNKIKDIESNLIKKKYQSLINDSSVWEIDPNRMFTFDANNYPTQTPDKELSSYFTKHYYKLVDKLNNEELEFAKYIDKLEEVECWIRNIDRNPQHSFWLQTSTDRFYPDFVLQLKNGKVLVVEYKGKHLQNEDTAEKEKVGLMWASLSDQTGFAMVFKDDYKAKMQALL